LQFADSVTKLGPTEANRRARPSPYRDLVLPSGVDLAAIDSSVVNGLGGMRTNVIRPPLLPQYQKWVDALPRENLGAQENSPGSNNWVISGKLTASGRVIVANDPHRNVANPSIRYIVHLNAPGWNTIGATEPPLPGVAIGHNGRIAWGLTILGTDQSDVYVERVNPANRNQVMFRGQWQPLRIAMDTIRVKDAPTYIAVQKYSRHGPIFYEDTVRHLAYAMRSTMHEPGSAGYVSALRYHTLTDCNGFLAEQKYYAAPTENMICGDDSGNIAWHASALTPKRPNWHGRLPVPGTGEYEWDGFRTDLPRELNPERGWIVTANHDTHPPNFDPPLFFKAGPSRGRYDRIVQMIGLQSAPFTVDHMKRMQHDALNATAARDIALFRDWTSNDPDVEQARKAIAEWNGQLRRGSIAAALYDAIANRPLAQAREAATDAKARAAVLDPALRAALESLTRDLGADRTQWRWGRIHRSEFPHTLVRAYDIPAVERDGGMGVVAATGATYRQIIDFANLDASMATNVPGQSGQPGSPFYANLVESFGNGEYFPLSYTRAAVERNAAHRLVLAPRR
jgi:penicillin G amidase